ncbi:hypothetical protein NK553_13315 [Pseudomonas sp. ZM23]|uniref:Sel1 repeat family protein n=1 Tax=Pseudomonas triclosanedens TaxID=2961893 RepID=A0ABY7A3L4_9PSED|nr:hypothetical protein [Pseudomonas triclosanedens]MCP8464927.1 hypothetical protein [Pseudomonas triclosanedens]MCP8470361.1 hypothetical protein [Pseudomonas triclosanedens]MCP8476166.1 hypothetical protein [Pseudomonas triclosanedens]WAI51601.1 hypothetical protein OU419_10240 [Pseudomonas triclosanedens]
MGKHHLHSFAAILALPLLIAGCAGSATAPCDEPMSGERCRDERLLYQNDMLQAKLLIASGDLGNYELAEALLDRAQASDVRGEASFYKALLKIKEGPQVDEVLELLQRAADEGQPYAVALLYKIWSEPYLVPRTDPEKARQYHDAYARLDVARSGYPSFEKALALVNGLLAEQPAVATQPLP